MSSDEKGRVVPLRRSRCPICGGRAEPRYRPFCSRRCADRDLARWFGERYRVATEEGPAAEATGPEQD